MRVGRALQVRQASLRAHEAAAHIDVHHQVVALEGRVGRAREADGAGVVDQDVNAAEVLGRAGHGGLHGVFVADVDLQGQGAAARSFDLGRRGVDGAGQAWVGRRGFGGDDDVGAVARGAQRDGQADAAAGAADEEGLALQGGHVDSEKVRSDRTLAGRAGLGLRQLAEPGETPISLQTPRWREPEMMSLGRNPVTWRMAWLKCVASG